MGSGGCAAVDRAREETGMSDREVMRLALEAFELALDLLQVLLA